MPRAGLAGAGRWALAAASAGKTSAEGGGSGGGRGGKNGRGDNRGGMAVVGSDQIEIIRFYTLLCACVGCARAARCVDTVFPVRSTRL